jgi:hypothetical protein
MSLSTNVSNLATRVATEIKAVRTLVNGNAADLSTLSTTSKNNLVAAINEIYSALATAGVQINDAAASTGSVYSSTKTDAQIAAAVSSLVDGAPELLDTLNELAAAINDDANFAVTIENQIAAKADAVHSHSISDVTNLQTALDAKANAADVGDHTTNFVTTFEAGLV